MAKKIKRVETPIDQRETFVSIQKNFADSEVTVEEKLKTLYDLQKADNAIDKILQLRGELPSEVKQLEEEVESLNAKAAKITEVVEGYMKSISDNKQNIVDSDTAISQYQKQLENITNSREYDSLNKEIENQGLLREIAEKNINSARVIIAEQRTALEDIKDHIAIREDDLKAKKEELDTIVESTSGDEAKLREARANCAGKIDARTMSAYERIRGRAHNHLAVVTVFDGNACGGCFNTIIPQVLIDIASRKKLVICEHCGRIIVSPDLDE